MRVDRVLVLAAHFPPAYLGGGPITTLDVLVRAAPPGVAIDVLTSDRDLNQAAPLEVVRNQWTSHPRGRINYASTGDPSGFLRILLGTRRSRPDVVYANSFFHPLFSILPWLLFRAGCWRRASFVLAPRGDFGQQALARKSLKKQLAIRLFRLLRLPTQVVWHASTEAEADSIRHVMGADVHIVVRRDDTDLPATAPVVESRDPGPLRIVHLGRVVPIKGLDVLLEALTGLSEPVVLDVYGPLEDERHVERCRQLSAQLPDHVEVNLVGPIRPDQVAAVLGEADVMAMPTGGESFGHVIAEALAASCPVIVPDTTSWNRVLNSGGGVVVASREPGAWTGAIADYVAHGPDAWLERRRDAAAAYDKWALESVDVHLFDKLRALRD